MDQNRFGAHNISVMLAFLLAAISQTTILEAQFGPLLSPAQAPQARSQEELDAYLEVTTATDAQEVLREVDRFVSRFPKSELVGVALQYQMRAFKQLNDFDAMLAAGEKALRANPDNLNTLLTLAPAMAKRAAQRPDRGALLAQAEDYAHRALEGLEKTQIPRKIPIEEWELKKQGMQCQAHEVLGVVAFKRGQAQTAIREFETAVRLAPTPEGIWFLELGMAYGSVGERGKAEKSLRRAADLGPDSIRKLAQDEIKKNY